MLERQQRKLQRLGVLGELFAAFAGDVVVLVVAPVDGDVRARGGGTLQDFEEVEQGLGRGRIEIDQLQIEHDRAGRFGGQAEAGGDCSVQ